MKSWEPMRRGIWALPLKSPLESRRCARKGARSYPRSKSKTFDHSRGCLNERRLKPLVAQYPTAQAVLIFRNITSGPSGPALLALGAAPATGWQHRSRTAPAAQRGRTWRDGRRLFGGSRHPGGPSASFLEPSACLSETNPGRIVVGRLVGPHEPGERLRPMAASFSKWRSLGRHEPRMGGEL